MTDIRYLAPHTLDEAIGAFAAAGSAARILAGGTDLLVQMRAGSVKPGLIVDIKKIAEMTAIEETADGGFRVGAAVPGAVLAEHPRFGRVWPGVLEAVNLIGSTQVQGRASAGGNLCNGSPARTGVARCWWSRCPRVPAAPTFCQAKFLSASYCRRGRRGQATPICA